jgi:hypothetical protein
VTEEYVDLEARIRAQRAVEAQYLAVLKDAKTIPDVLAVQQKLGEARTEIERAEGRRRFLENQTSLSTITVHLARHIAAVEASGPGFGRSVREACNDAVVVAIAIVNGAIRLVGVLLPVGLLIVAPAVLLLRVWWRRRRKRGDVGQPVTARTSTRPTRRSPRETPGSRSRRRASTPLRRGRWPPRPTAETRLPPRRTSGPASSRRRGR